MSFNPLGIFDPEAVITPELIAAANNLLAKLPDCPPGTLDHIYNHWSVGHFDQQFADYNVSESFDGNAHLLTITHDPRDNARGVNDNAPAAHTWLRNTGGIGVTIDAMVGASVHNYGLEPITVVSVQYLCAANAAIAKKYGVDLGSKTQGSPYENEFPIMTHACAAMTGGNPPPAGWYDYGITGTFERWDLASLVAPPEGVPLTSEMAWTVNAAIIAFSRRIKLALD